MQTSPHPQRTTYSTSEPLARPAPLTMFVIAIESRGTQEIFVTDIYGLQNKQGSTPYVVAQDRAARHGLQVLGSFKSTEALGQGIDRLTCIELNSAVSAQGQLDGEKYTPRHAH